MFIMIMSPHTTAHLTDARYTACSTSFQLWSAQDATPAPHPAVQTLEFMLPSHMRYKPRRSACKHQQSLKYHIVSLGTTQVSPLLGKWLRCDCQLSPNANLQHDQHACQLHPISPPPEQAVQPLRRYILSKLSCARMQSTYAIGVVVNA